VRCFEAVGGIKWRRVHGREDSKSAVSEQGMYTWRKDERSSAAGYPEGTREKRRAGRESRELAAHSGGERCQPASWREEKLPASVHGHYRLRLPRSMRSEDPGEEAVHLVPEVHPEEEEDGKEEQVGHVVGAALLVGPPQPLHRLPQGPSRLLHRALQPLHHLRRQAALLPDGLGDLQAGSWAGRVTVGRRVGAAAAAAAAAGKGCSAGTRVRTLAMPPSLPRTAHLLQPAHRAAQLVDFVVQVQGARLDVDLQLIAVRWGGGSKQRLSGAETWPAAGWRQQWQGRFKPLAGGLAAAASCLPLPSDAPASISGPQAMPLPVAHAASGRGARGKRPWVPVRACPEQQRCASCSEDAAETGQAATATRLENISCTGGGDGAGAAPTAGGRALPFAAAPLASST
jgi:hypothetical protein